MVWWLGISKFSGAVGGEREGRARQNRGGRQRKSMEKREGELKQNAPFRLGASSAPVDRTLPQQWLGPAASPCLLHLCSPFFPVAFLPYAQHYRGNWKKNEKKIVPQTFQLRRKPGGVVAGYQQIFRSSRRREGGTSKTEQRRETEKEHGEERRGIKTKCTVSTWGKFRACRQNTSTTMAGACSFTLPVAPVFSFFPRCISSICPTLQRKLKKK